MRLGKKVLSGLTLLLLGLGVTAGVKTATTRPRPPAAAPTEVSGFDSAAELALAQRLGGALRIPTVSREGQPPAAAELRALLAARAEQVAVLDAELAERNAERVGVAAELPGDLLELYDRIRVKSGSGAAALIRRRCSGCQLEATAADLTRYRSAPPDEVLRCEECNRILVRTAESGL